MNKECPINKLQKVLFIVRQDGNVLPDDNIEYSTNIAKFVHVKFFILIGET